MASTYSDRLKLELMETGANANTWGNNTNTNLQTLDAFTAGYLSKDVAGSANVTLTSNNADPTAESSNKVIEFTGTLTDNIYVFIPAVENNYIFFNNTSGAFTVTIAPDGHAANGVAITQGAHTIMYNTASNEVKDLFSGSLGNLSLVSGGVFTGNASGASALNASNVSSGTIDDARLTANVTLNNASTISAGTLADARLTANVNLNNASTISTGTLNNDRLDTVPTTKGGTGLTSVGSEGQVLTVTAPGALAFQDAAGGGGGYKMTVFTSPGTYTKPADVKDLKVTVVGGGGSAGYSGGTSCTQQGGAGGGGGTAIEYLPEASVPGPVAVTVGASGAGGSPRRFCVGCSGGTSSFGAFLSATGGTGGCVGSPDYNACCPQSLGGTGSGGTLNFKGGAGHRSRIAGGETDWRRMVNAGAGGTHLSGDGSASAANAYGCCPAAIGSFTGGVNTGVGGGISCVCSGSYNNASGSDGVVIVEEFF